MGDYRLEMMNGGDLSKSAYLVLKKLATTDKNMTNDKYYNIHSCLVTAVESWINNTQTGMVCMAIICYILLNNDILIDSQYSNSLILDSSDILIDRQYSNSLILDTSDIMIDSQYSNSLILDTSDILIDR